MLLRPFTVGVFVFATVGIGNAQEQKKPADDLVKVEGYGVGMNKTCGAFLRQTDDKDAGKALNYQSKTWYPELRLYFEWLSGFFTARSLVGQPVVGERNMNDMVTWLRTYCQAHPLGSVLDGAIALAAEVSKQ